MHIAIREIKPEEKGTLGDVYSAVITQEFPEYNELLKKGFSSGKYKESMLARPICLGAYVDDRLIGFLLSSRPEGGVVFVYWLGMLKAYQGKGIGSKLLQHFEDMVRAQQVHAIELQADERNVPFYEKLGFTKIGFDDKGYYGTSCYLMKKQIQEPHENTWFN